MPTNSNAVGAGPPNAEEPSAEYLRKEEAKAARKAFMADFGARATVARGKRSVSDVAARLGVHRNTIWNIESGETLPDVYGLVQMAHEYGTTVSQLLGVRDLVAWAEPSNHAVEIENYVFVPHFDIQASAGTGSFQDLGNVVAMRPFDAAYIRGDLGISHDEIGMCGVIGTSGEPVLHSGDTVLVDFRDRSVMIEGLHIVRLDGLPLLKKLQRLPGKVLRVSSNNDDYAPFEIAAGEESQRDFEVIGRVRWAGVTFR